MHPSLFLTEVTTLVSSANLETLHLRPLSKSFIYIRNKSGPSTEPCGTSLFTVSHNDLLPLSNTHCLLFFNHSLIQLCTIPSIPYCDNFCISLTWGTLSKALLKSKYMTSTGSPLSIHSVIYSIFHIRIWDKSRKK